MDRIILQQYGTQCLSGMDVLKYAGTFLKSNMCDTSYVSSVLKLMQLNKQKKDDMTAEHLLDL